MKVIITTNAQKNLFDIRKYIRLTTHQSKN